MGFRFRRSFKIAPGIRLNLNSKSASVRIGPKGLGYTIRSGGKKRIGPPVSGGGNAYSQVSPGVGTQPARGGQRKGRLWPAVIAIIAIVVVVGSLNNKTEPSRTTNTNVVSLPPTPIPPAIGPKEAPPIILTQPALHNSTSQDASIPAPLEIRYVTASSLNIRSAPDTTGDIIGKLGEGQEAPVLSRENGWLLIKTAMGTEGWISERYTSSTAVAATTSGPAQAFLSPPEPAVDRDSIIQKIIDRSIQNYSGSCPCPYNTMRNGRRCGGNSAYSKPGGRSPICFASDVTEAMIAAFRN